jgi:hypothetical protein
MRGEASMAICRQCHCRMSASPDIYCIEALEASDVKINILSADVSCAAFRIPEVKFLQVSTATGMFITLCKATSKKLSSKER